MGRLIIENAILVTMEQDEKATHQSYFVGEIAIEDSLIKHIGQPGTIPSDFNAERVINGENKVVLPGLINAHTHAAMTLLRGYADDLPLMKWLEDRIWPVEGKLEPEDVYWGTMLSNLEMLKAGVTTFADMYFHMEEVAKAVAKTGMRASLARGMVGGKQKDIALKEAETLVENWHGFDDNRISVMLGPHAPYTCSPDFIQEVVEKAKQLGIGIHIHLGETLDEIKNIKSEYGKPPVELMDSLGLFNVPVLAAHCVHLEPHELTILRDNNVSVVHNPESNMKLASGIAPVPEMLDKGIVVALGTDGAASNNNLELFGEMRTAALLHKVNKMNPTVLNAYQTLKMATVEGAKALGLENIGMLKQGYKADLIMVDLSKPHYYPLHNVIAHLVYAAQPADVDLVMVDGRILVENDEPLTIDQEEVFGQVKRIAQRLTK